MGEFSLTHILIVLIIFLVFFGPKKLPQLGQSLGEAIRGFKDAMNTDPSKEAEQKRQQAQQPTPAQHQHQTEALHEAPPVQQNESTETMATATATAPKDPNRQS